MVTPHSQADDRSSMEQRQRDLRQDDHANGQWATGPAARSGTHALLMPQNTGSGSHTSLTQFVAAPTREPARCSGSSHPRGRSERDHHSRSTGASHPDEEARESVISRSASWCAQTPRRRAVIACGEVCGSASFVARGENAVAVGPRRGFRLSRRPTSPDARACGLRSGSPISVVAVTGYFFGTGRRAAENRRRS
jgi:hypothetical protein